jgi:hypothetical protein
VKKVLLSYLEEHLAANKEVLRTHLAYIFSRPVFSSTLGRITKAFCWSWKVLTTFQIHKYRLNNVIRYLHYLSEVCKKRSNNSNNFLDSKYGSFALEI